jgi:hypothetical protein
MAATLNMYVTVKYCLFQDIKLNSGLEASRKTKCFSQKPPTNKIFSSECNLAI